MRKQLSTHMIVALLFIINNSNTFAAKKVRAPECPPPPPPVVFGLVPTQNPDAPAVAFFPNAGASNSNALPPQILDLTFVAGNNGDIPSTNGTPPDTMGVAGPEQFVMSINGGIISFDKEGNRDGMLDVEACSFLNTDLDFSAKVNAFDPRVRYDQHSDRFYFSWVNKDFAGFSLALSDSGILNEHTHWKVINVFDFTIIPDSIGCPGDEGSNIDFVMLGSDKDAVYLAGNIFAAADEGFVSNSLFVIPKKPLFADGPVVITAFRDVIGYPGDSDPYREASSTFQTVDNFDTDSKFGYFIGQDPEEFGKLNLFRVINPGSNAPELSPVIEITIPTTSSDADVLNPHFPPLFGHSGQIDASDDRPHMAFIRNKQLYTVQLLLVDEDGIASQSGDRRGIRWYQLDLTGDASGKGLGIETATTVPALVQIGTIFDNTTTLTPLWFNMPSLMINERGDMVIGGTVSSETIPLSAFYVGRLATDPLGVMRVGPNNYGVLYALGSGSYTYNLNAKGQRWGDYSYTSLDPQDNMTIWTIQEAGVNGSQQLVVAKLLAP